MILYLKQSTEPGNLLFHVMDEWGHPCYQVLIDKHRFGKYIYIEQQSGKKSCRYSLYGFFKMLPQQYFHKRQKAHDFIMQFCSFRTFV